MLQITITLTDDGRFGVQSTGNLADKIAHYGMLDLARDAIRDYKAPPLVAPAPAAALRHLPGHINGTGPKVG